MAGRVGLGPGRNIPADAGAGLGLFETLHDFASGAALADHIKAATGRLFGTAGRVLLERLAAEPEALAAAAQEAMARFLADRVPKGAAGQVQRAARRFALVAAGGEMAIALGILPWPKDEAERAAATCFEAWRAAREGGDGAAEDAMALAAVRHFIGTHDARFEVWEPKNSGGAAATAPGEVLPQREPHPVPNRAGWKKPDGEGWRYCILPETWRREVVPGLDPESAARAVRAAGFLVPQSKRAPRHTRMERVGLSDPVRVYVVRDTILSGGAEDEEAAP